MRAYSRVDPGVVAFAKDRRYHPLDALDYMLILFEDKITNDQGTYPWKNYGTAGSSQNMVAVDNFKIGWGGIWGPAGFFSTNGTDGDGEAAASNPNTSNVSWMVWVKYVAVIGSPFYKAYGDSGWTSPYIGLGLNHGGSGGTIQALCNTSSTLRQTGSTATIPTVAGPWNHYCGTYDGATLSCYHNGALSGSASVSGTLTYGTPGKWRLNATNQSDESGDCIYQYFRMRNEVVSAAWLREEYALGAGYYL